MYALFVDTNMSNYTTPFLNSTMEPTNATENISSKAIAVSTKAPKVYENVVYHQILNVYLMIAVTVVGLVMNGLVVAVMRDKVFNKLPLSVYFTAIAVCDSVMLVMSTVMQTMKEIAHINMFSKAKLCSSLG